MSMPKELFRRVGLPAYPQRDAETVDVRTVQRPGNISPDDRTMPPGKNLSAESTPESVSSSMRVIVPQEIRSRSVYRQLMRSHDRMSSQHLRG